LRGWRGRRSCTGGCEGRDGREKRRREVGGPAGSGVSEQPAELATNDGAGAGDEVGEGEVDADEAGEGDDRLGDRSGDEKFDGHFWIAAPVAEQGRVDVESSVQAQATVEAGVSRERQQPQ